jgi:protein TonB
MLKAYVTPAGRADQVQVQKSSGVPALDEAAFNVVKNRWRFAPAKQGDKAVGAWVVIPLEFSLTDH